MRRFWRGFASCLLDVLLICGFTYCMYRSYTLSEENFIGVGFTEAGFFLFSWIFVPALHEVGHFIAGKAVGMRMAEMSFSFFKIYRENEKFVCRLINPFKGNVAGSCLSYPDPPENVRMKYAWFAAGGLIANFLYATIGLIFVLLFDNAYLWASLGITLPYCIYALIVNLLPFGDDYDGMVLFGLLKNDSTQLTRANIFSVQGYLSKGLTPGEIDKSLYFSAPQLPEDDEAFALLQYYRYAYYLDRGEAGEAIKSITRLESCLEYIPQQYLAAVCVELAFTYSNLQKNKELAERYHAYAERQKEVTHASAYFRASLAYALLTDNEKLKEKTLPLYASALEEEYVDGIKKFEKKLYDELYGG